MPSTPAADGSTLAWHGRGSDRALVLLPGLSLGRVCLLPLRGLGRRDLALDPRGVARSRPAVLPRDLDGYADDAVAVLDALGLPRADVLALSFGAAVAQRLLARHPSRVGKAVLVSAPVGRRAERDAYVRTLLGLAEAGDLSGLWAALAPRLVARGTARPEAVWRGLGRLVPPLLLRTDAPAVAAQLGALLALPDDAVDQLAGVDRPVLLVRGERDQLVPPGDTARLAALLPASRTHVVPRVGHLAPVHVREVRRVVRTFLAGP